MFEGTSDVLAGVCPKRYPEKRKRQTEVNCPPSPSVKKFKWNGTVHTSDEIGNVENQLASTRMWRQLLFNNGFRKNKPLVKSEEIFRENIFVLLYGIDKCAGNPAQWKTEDTSFFFTKFMSFVDSWKKQLLKENGDGKLFLMKGKLKNKRNCDLVTNVSNVLANVYYESLKFIKFSATQRKAIDSKVKELNYPLTQVDSQVMLDGCLQGKEKQLNELKKQLDWSAKKQKETEGELTETREQLLQSFVAKSREMIQTKQKDMNKKLSDIQILLLMKNPNNRPSCQIENESLNKEEKIFKDIKAIIDYEIKSADVYQEELRKAQDSLEEAHLKSNKSSLATELKNRYHELNEAWKQADNCHEELRKTPDSLKEAEAHLKFNKSSLASEMLKNKNHELIEARQQADAFLEELRKTQDSLREAHLKFNESSLATELKNKDHELIGARKQADEYLEELREAHLKFNESSLATELKNKDHELNEARKQADKYLKKLRKAQNSLKKSHFKLVDLMPTNNSLTQVDSQVMIDGCLRDKEKQLNELKKQLDWSAKKQKETEGELTEAREQLQSFVTKSREMTQTKQKDMNRKLSDIQTLLLMKNPNYRPSCGIENESLNKEEKIFKDIKAIIEYKIKSSNSDNNCKQNSTESALEISSSSASLRVSEYEMHLVTLIAAFLKITPYPVSSHNIYSYVSNIDSVVDLQFVESLLRKFPSIFKEVAGAPGSVEKYWIYVDLKPVITI